MWACACKCNAQGFLKNCDDKGSLRERKRERETTMCFLLPSTPEIMKYKKDFNKFSFIYVDTYNEKNKSK